MDEVRLVVSGDWHLRSKTPPSRFEFLSAFVDKWGEICSIAESFRADATILLGDVYNSLTGSGVSHGLVGWTIRQLGKSKVPVLAIPGNHDVRLDKNLKHLLKRPFGVLLASDKIKLLNEKGVVIKHVRLCGSENPMTIDSDVSNYSMPEFNDGRVGVMVTHGNLVFPGYSCWGPVYTKIEDLDSCNYPQMLHLNGHLHNQQAIYKGRHCTYLSPSALMRGYDMYHNLNTDVTVGLVIIRGQEVKVNLHKLKSPKPFEEAFKVEEVEAERVRGRKMSEFIDMVEEQAQTESLMEDISEVVRKMNLPKKVANRVNKYLLSVES